jgi:transposase
VENAGLAPPKKKARRERRTLVFLDESGLSQRPRRASTWAPRGQTPILTFNFNWKSLSAIAGLTARDFYFQLHEGSIKSPQVIGFLQALHRQVPGKVLLLWDGAPIHRSHVVSAYLQTQTHWLHVERLPAYAPELNPVEYLWAYWKKTELANFCPKNIWELSHAASQALKRIRRPKRRPQLIAAFFAQAELF